MYRKILVPMERSKETEKVFRVVNLHVVGIYPCKGTDAPLDALTVGDYGTNELLKTRERR